ncbi:MAG TPA: EsaB/YukD family protein [Bacillota bacterium]|nr:EsaB/YukD family protein [Bacillota bacterium]
MYINLTVDLYHNKDETIEIRISDQHTVKGFIDIVHQITEQEFDNDKHWIRVSNKQKVFYGNATLESCGITTGDRIKIL